MNLFNLSSPKNYYLLTFSDCKPVWEICGPNGRKKADKPSRKSRVPVLAVIPDRYFFYYLPQNLQAKNRRTMLRAAELHLRHVFPAPHEKESLEIMDTGTHILGIFHRPDLDSFIRDNQDDLTMAGSISTPLLLGLALMPRTGNQDWILRNPGDPTIMFSRNKLDYFSGDEQELKQRMDILGSGPEFHTVDIDSLLARLSATPVPWSGFRLTLPRLESGRGQPLTLIKAAMGVLVVGLTFCLGDYFKLRSITQEKTQWEQKLDALYTRALGPEYGPDPYGLLLYHADQASGRAARGLDFMDFLGHLSLAAPESLIIETITLSMDSGSLRASLSTYDKMEIFLDNLKQASGYAFTLDQADSSEGRVNLVLSFRF